MDPVISLLFPVLTGMLLLCIGYSYRERAIGVFILWLGVICMLGTATYKILEKLS